MVFFVVLFSLQWTCNIFKWKLSGFFLVKLLYCSRNFNKHKFQFSFTKDFIQMLFFIENTGLLFCFWMLWVNGSVTSFCFRYSPQKLVKRNFRSQCKIWRMNYYWMNDYFSLKTVDFYFALECYGQMAVHHIFPSDIDLRNLWKRILDHYVKYEEWIIICWQHRHTFIGDLILWMMTAGSKKRYNLQFYQELLYQFDIWSTPGDLSSAVEYQWESLYFTWTFWPK